MNFRPYLKFNPCKHHARLPQRRMQIPIKLRLLKIRIQIRLAVPLPVRLQTRESQPSDRWDRPQIQGFAKLSHRPST